MADEWTVDGLRDDWRKMLMDVLNEPIGQLADDIYVERGPYAGGHIVYELHEEKLTGLGYRPAGVNPPMMLPWCHAGKLFKDVAMLAWDRYDAYLGDPPMFGSMGAGQFVKILIEGHDT